MRKKEKGEITKFFEKWFGVIFILLGAFIYMLVYGGHIEIFNNYLMAPYNEDTDAMYKDSIARFGQFGDYVGGILNPTFAFLSFIAILLTLRIQIEALNTSKEELVKSSEALVEQANSIKIQNFENTFFNMLNLHTEIINNLSLVRLKKAQCTINNGIYQCYSILGTPVRVKEDQDYIGKKVISKLFEIADAYIRDDNTKNIAKLYNDFYLEYNEITGHYFRNIYQILKFINTQEVLKNEDKNKELENKKFYANILRSQLSNSELALLFLNGLSKEGEEKLLPLLVKFEFMEPLALSLSESDTEASVLKSIIDTSYLDNLICLYIEKTKDLNINNNYSNNKIFGSNREWGKYINYINISSQEQQ